MRRFEEGASFGRYRIVRFLGAGGAGQVYAADDAVLQRRIALKIWNDASLAETLVHEARLASSLRHPNIVVIFDAGLIDGVAFLAMELLDGRSLRAFLGDASLLLEQRIAWLVQIVQALEETHARGLVHRDVKPDNVFVCTNGAVKLLDFGIAKRAHDAQVTLDTAAPTPTESGLVRGTPRYMSPEQIAGVSTDPRTDQYAWGIVAYELLCGAHPSAKGGLLLSQLDPRISFPLAAAVQRALAQRPSERFASMSELLSALRSTAPAPGATTIANPTGAPPAFHAPPRGRFLVIVAVILALVTVSAVSVAVVVIVLRPPAAPIAIAPEAAAPSSPPVTSTPPVAASASSSASARAPAPPKPVGPVKRNCACFAPGVSASLCPTEAYRAAPVCKCESDDNFHLCVARWAPDATGAVRCLDDAFAGTPATKDGEVCHGYQNADKPISSGKLQSCLHCPQGAVFSGRAGEACRGVDERRRPYEGKLECR